MSLRAVRCPGAASSIGVILLIQVFLAAVQVVVTLAFRDGAPAEARAARIASPGASI